MGKQETYAGRLCGDHVLRTVTVTADGQQVTGVVRTVVQHSTATAVFFEGWPADTPVLVEPASTVVVS